MINIRKQTSELVTMHEAAARIGVTHQTLSQYRLAGKLTAQQAGKIWLVNPETAKQELEEDGFFIRRENRKARWQK